MKYVLGILIIVGGLFAGSQAYSRTQTSLPYSCGTVRWAVAHFSPAVLERLAKTYGITPRQRKQAEACLRKGEAVGKH